MNPLKLSFIGLFMVFITQTSQSQDNVIKLHLTGLAIGNVGLSYERVIAEKQSLVINAGLLIPRKIPGMIVTAAELGTDSKMSGFSLVPEYRFYLSGKKKEAPRGFYVAPYLLVSNYSVELNHDYQTHNINAKSSLFTVGAGAQIGIHWIISDLISLDWTIIGLGVNRYSLIADLSTKDANVNFAQMEADIKDEVDGVPIIGSKLKTSSGPDFLKLELPVFHLGVRSSFSIGIAF